MAFIDCFNGDADGICALTQLRLQNPVESELITGVKRDVALLDRAVAVQGDLVTVLDVSLDKNRADVERLLGQGAEVFYCDHHFAGDIPNHRKLTTLINTTADVCTSLLINQSLKGRFLEWAVVGTFGDNLERSARGLAKPLELRDAQLQQLHDLGVYLNYNGYGATLADLYYHPADLFKKTSKHTSALSFINEDTDTYSTLKNGYNEDMSRAAAASATYDHAHAAVFQLPDQAWARRVSGVYGNDLANNAPQRAHAVLTKKSAGGFVVSVRAPLDNKQGADKVCRQFDTGGGRAAAAGINHLPESDYDSFVSVFSEYYKG